MPALRAWAILILAIAALAVVFKRVPDVWTGMTVTMGVLSLLALGIPGVFQRLSPSIFRVFLGLVTAGALYGMTVAGVELFGLKEGMGALFAWKGSHSTTFLALTLALVIVPGEELVWRGVVVL